MSCLPGSVPVEVRDATRRTSRRANYYSLILRGRKRCSTASGSQRTICGTTSMLREAREKCRSRHPIGDEVITFHGDGANTLTSKADKQGDNERGLMNRETFMLRLSALHPRVRARSGRALLPRGRAGQFLPGVGGGNRGGLTQRFFFRAHEFWPKSPDCGKNQSRGFLNSEDGEKRNAAKAWARPPFKPAAVMRPRSARRDDGAAWLPLTSRSDGCGASSSR